MRLLVSVANAAEAAAAATGGADVIDAKNPLAGPLGAVTQETLIEIHAAVAGRRLVTAALGDSSDETATEHTARALAVAGAAFVKVGFAGVRNVDRVKALTAAAVRGARIGPSGVVVVAYVDAGRVASVGPPFLIDVAAQAGADGILFDTADKAGPGLRALIAPRTLAASVAHAKKTGLFVALAGKLTADDLRFVRDAGADIVGVRGAACDGGRTGPISADKVRLLQNAVSGFLPRAVEFSTRSGVFPPRPRR